MKAKKSAWHWAAHCIRHTNYNAREHNRRVDPWKTSFFRPVSALPKLGVPEAPMDVYLRAAAERRKTVLNAIAAKRCHESLAAAYLRRASRLIPRGFAVPPEPPPIKMEAL